jgi:hypothetical protein
MQLADQERESIGGFLDQFRGWLACAMPGTRLDADQDRRRTGLRRLQRGCVFETVAWHHAVIVIRRCY